MYWKLIMEAVDRTVWRTGFERVCGPVVRLVAARRTGTNVPIAPYSLLNVAPDDGLMIVRNM